MTEKAKTVLDEVVSKITGDTVSRYVRHRLFSDEADIPCRKWSPLNQFTVCLAGTYDARGMKQWNQAGRRVKKGAHAVYILVPMLYPAEKKPKQAAPDEAGTAQKVLTGFKVMPVFRMEDTEGAPLDYELTLKAFDIESLPLIEAAESLGVTVRAGLTAGASGSYSPAHKLITVGTDNLQVFLHELSHAVDYALPNRKEDYDFGEVTAELSSAFLGSLCGVPADIAGTKAYIESYTGKGHIAFRVMEALQRVEEIYRYIETALPPQEQKKARKTAKTGNLALEQRPKPAGQDLKAAGEENLFGGIPAEKHSQTAESKQRKKRFDEAELFQSAKKETLSKRIPKETDPRIIEFPAALRNN